VTAIETLAREIGFPWQPRFEHQDVLVNYVAALATQLSQRGTPPDDPPHPAAKPIAAALGAVLRSEATDKDLLVTIADHFVKLVDALDCIDGWPADEHLHAVKSLAWAIKCGIGDPTALRWLAVAGYDVSRLVLGLDTHDPVDRPAQHTYMRKTLQKAIEMVPEARP
jgi:hypothetical protein